MSVMRIYRRFWGIAASIALLFPLALFSDTLSISGNPAAMSITTATAGSNPDSATDNSTTCNMTTLTVVRKVTGKINTNMPTGLTLRVQIAAPTGATSAGSVAMTTTAANLITAIPKSTTATNLEITYTLAATPTAAPATAVTRILTLTLQ